MKRILLAASALALAVSAAASASVPPPPPPPPDGLPESYDGYSTERLWYAYLYWVRGETVTRRQAAFDALRLPGYSDDPGAWRTELEGPSYVAVSWWIPHGNLFAFEEVCPASAGYTNPEGCLWRYRSAFFRAQEHDIHAIAYDTFDGAGFAERLRAAGIAPEAVDNNYRSDFGLAAETREIREDTCPGVRDGIESLAVISLPLSPYGPPAETPPPPPPAPPSGDRETLTIPVGFYPDMDVTVTMVSNGSGSMGALLSGLIGPVNACIQAAQD
jgi:hypothetical protein